MPTRHTPYHQRFVELGAEMGDRIGFDAAVVFTSTEREHMVTRDGVGLYDVHYQGPIDIKGPDAQALLDHEGRAVEARITHRPFYDPDGSRVRG